MTLVWTVVSGLCQAHEGRDGYALSLVSIMPVEIEVLTLKNVDKRHVTIPKVLHDLPYQHEAVSR